jgi:ABC-type uncharacterized transport system substrate-binding protein
MAMMRAALALSAAVCPGLIAVPAAAHPHVWVEARAEIVYEAGSRLIGVRHAWIFDEGFSAFAIQGLDVNNDRKLSREELQPLAEVNVTSLSEFRYFTYLRSKSGAVAEARNALLRGVLPGSAALWTVEFAAPKDYWLDYDGTVLTLHFTLPLKKPFAPGADPVTLEVYDAEYFVAFSLAKQDPVRLVGADPGCRTSIERPKELDAATAMTLSQIPAENRNLPPELSNLTGDLANRITITCD